MAAMHRTAHHPLPSCTTRSTPPEPAWFQRFFAVSFAPFRSVPFSTVSVSFHRSFHFPRSLCPLYLSLSFAHGTKRRDREWHPAGLSQPPPIPDTSLRYPARYSVFTIIIVVRFLSDSILLRSSALFSADLLCLFPSPLLSRRFSSLPPARFVYQKSQPTRDNRSSVATANILRVDVLRPFPFFSPSFFLAHVLSSFFLLSVLFPLFPHFFFLFCCSIVCLFGLFSSNRAAFFFDPTPRPPPRDRSLLPHSEAFLRAVSVSNADAEWILQSGNFSDNVWRLIPDPFEALFSPAFHPRGKHHTFRKTIVVVSTTKSPL